MVKYAVQSINWGNMKSPIGTAKNMNAKGKKIARATCSPNTAGTANTSSAVKANWVTELTATRSPSSHIKASPATGSKSMGAGRGTSNARSCRRRQISHSAIGGTTKPWAKVSERYQMVTMAKPVSRYRKRIHAHDSRRAGSAIRQEYTGCSDVDCIINC